MACNPSPCLLNYVFVVIAMAQFVSSQLCILLDNISARGCNNYHLVLIARTELEFKGFAGCPLAV